MKWRIVKNRLICIIIIYWQFFINFCRDKTDERSSFSYLSEKINIDYNWQKSPTDDKFWLSIFTGTFTKARPQTPYAIKVGFESITALRNIYWQGPVRWISWYGQACFFRWMAGGWTLQLLGKLKATEVWKWRGCGVELVSNGQMLTVRWQMPSCQPPSFPLLLSPTKADRQTTRQPSTPCTWHSRPDKSGQRWQKNVENYAASKHP